MPDPNYFKSDIDAIETLEGLKERAMDFAQDVAQAEIFNFPPDEKIRDRCKVIQTSMSDIIGCLESLDKIMEEYRTR